MTLLIFGSPQVLPAGKQEPFVTGDIQTSRTQELEKGIQLYSFFHRKKSDKIGFKLKQGTKASSCE